MSHVFSCYAHALPCGARALAITSSRSRDRHNDSVVLPTTTRGSVGGRGLCRSLPATRGSSGRSDTGIVPGAAVFVLERLLALDLGMADWEFVSLQIHSIGSRVVTYTLHSFDTGSSSSRAAQDIRETCDPSCHSCDKSRWPGSAARGSRATCDLLSRSCGRS